MTETTAPLPPRVKYCPRCLRPETEIASDGCIMTSMPGFDCPQPVEEDPVKTVVLDCRVCNFTRVVPVGELLKGLPADRSLPKCRRDVCSATILLPTQATPPPLPAPASFTETDPVLDDALAKGAAAVAARKQDLATKKK